MVLASVVVVVSFVVVVVASVVVVVATMVVVVASVVVVDGEDDGEEDDDDCCHQMVPDVPSEPPDNDCDSCGRLMSRGEAMQACKFCGFDICSECITKKTPRKTKRKRLRKIKNNNCDQAI